MDDSNLQRQIVHSTERLGEPKVASAQRTIEALNLDVNVVPFQERLDSENIERILAHGWDVIVDGHRQLPDPLPRQRRLGLARIPVVHGSIYRFEGQVTVFIRGTAPATAAFGAAAARARAELREGGVLGVPASSARSRRARR